MANKELKALFEMGETGIYKGLILDWKNYYECAGSPVKTKDINKTMQEWKKTITPDIKAKAEKTGEFDTRKFCK